ncbi:MAG: glycosyltransferase [Candidatus Sericytochromatia bacterium]
MKWINRTLALGTLGAAALLVGSGLRMARHVRRELKASHVPVEVPYLPKVALMAPCKGLDPDFEDNLRSVLAQDYPNFELTLMTVNDQDPCYPVLERLAADSPVPTQIVFGGFSRQRCQKLDNMLAGLDAQSGTPDIYVWVDSDARVPKNWLRELVKPLARGEVGASTTFRWYRPEQGRPITYLLALWTGIQFSHFHINQAVAVWGGSMAVTRETFERLKMREVWQTSLADDCVLHDAVRKAKLRVEFVVPAMTSMSSELPLRDILIFAVRQSVIGKHTLKEIWWISMFGLGFLHLSAGRGLWLAARALAQGHPVPLAALGMLSFVPAGILQNLAVIHAIRQLAADRDDSDPMHAEYAWALLSPAAYLFVWSTLCASALTDRFVWREIHYRMLHAHATEVTGYPPALESAVRKEEAPTGRAE